MPGYSSNPRTRRPSPSVYCDFSGRLSCALVCARSGWRRARSFTWERAAELAEACFRRCYEDAARRGKERRGQGGAASESGPDRGTMQESGGFGVVGPLIIAERLRALPDPGPDQGLGELRRLKDDARPHEDLVGAVALLVTDRPANLSGRVQSARSA